MKKFFKGIALTIIVIALSLSTMALLALIPAKQIVSKQAIKKMISTVEIEQLEKENPELQQEINEILEPIYNETRPLGIEDETIIKVIDSKPVKDFTADVTSNIVDYIITGKNQKLVTTENIEELVGDAVDEINHEKIYEINDQQKQELLKIVKEEVEKNQNLIPDTKEIDKSLSKEDLQALSVIRFILGTKLLLCLITTLLISILLLLALKWKEAKWIQWSAITMLISSIISVFITGVCWMGNNLFFKTELPYIYKIINQIIRNSLILSASVFGTTIVILIIYKVVRKKRTKSKNEKKPIEENEKKELEKI